MKPRHFCVQRLGQRLGRRLARRLRLAVACVLAATSAVSAGASSHPSSHPSPRHPADVRAAQLAAYQALADRVLTLDVGDGSTVRKAVGRSNRVAGDLNRLIKQAALGTPFLHGGQLAIEASVSRDAVARTLTNLGAATPGQATILRAGGPDRISAVGVARGTHAGEPVVTTVPAVPAIPTARPRPIAQIAPTPPTPAPAPRPAPGAFRRYADDPVRLDTTHVHVDADLPGVRFGPSRNRGDGTVQVDAAATLEGDPAPTTGMYTATATGTGLVSTEHRP